MTLVSILFHKVVAFYTQHTLEPYLWFIDFVHFQELLSTAWKWIHWSWRRVLMP